MRTIRQKNIFSTPFFSRLNPLINDTIRLLILPNLLLYVISTKSSVIWNINALHNMISILYLPKSVSSSTSLFMQMNILYNAINIVFLLKISCYISFKDHILCDNDYLFIIFIHLFHLQISILLYSINRMTI